MNGAPNQNQMPPEVMAAYMRQLTQEEQDSDLQRQIAQAQEMRTGQGTARYGAGAGMLQGLADVLRAYKGKQMEGQARAERQKLWGQRDLDRTAIGQQWIAGQQPQQAQIPAAVPGPYNAMQADQAGVPPLLRRPGV